jgi:hypothetical protein
MKTLFFYFLLPFMVSVSAVNAQKENPANYLGSLPAGLTLDRSVARSYRMTTDYYYFDLKSNFSGKHRLTGYITCVGDSAMWKDVYYAGSNVLDAVFPAGTKKIFLQNFKYRQDEQVLTAEFFNSNLPEADPLIMNLIWDALGFEALAYCCWDSLKSGEEFKAGNINSEIKTANIGTFENKDMRITWLGIAEINSEICAVLKYSAMNNPLNIEYENI